MIVSHISSILVAVCLSATLGGKVEPDVPPLYSMTNTLTGDVLVVCTSKGISEGLMRGYNFNENIFCGFASSNKSTSSRMGKNYTDEQYRLKVYMNSLNNKTITVASDHGESMARKHGYDTLLFEDGWIWKAQNTTQRLPLTQYVCNQRNATIFILASTPQSVYNATHVHNCSFGWVEGFTDEAWVSWPSAPPVDLPFKQSLKFAPEVEFAFGVYSHNARAFAARSLSKSVQPASPPPPPPAPLGGADTWFPSFGGPHGRFYSTFNDGTVWNVSVMSDQRVTNTSAVQGYAVGCGDPLNITLIRVGSVTAGVSPFYKGRYSSANAFVDGVWYQGTYALDDHPPNVGWCVLGGFISFRTSLDEGLTWKEPTPQLQAANDTLFGEAGTWDVKVKFGAPHIVDHGTDNQHAPGKRLYMISHASNRTGPTEGWINGDTVYLTRTRTSPSPNTINNKESWEFWGGGSSGWVSSLQQAQPLFEWFQRTGVTTSVYVEQLSIFLTIVSCPGEDGYFATYILESEQLTGPFYLVAYLADFGPIAYEVTMPSKWIQVDKEAGVLDAWLSFSAWPHVREMTPPSGAYLWVLQKVRLKLTLPAES
eukprot:m.46271 g.46271  ORF g.46271 m.46271 type:complete len:594 (+) comp10352_c0_seq1:327-2108(+)